MDAIPVIAFGITLCDDDFLSDIEFSGAVDPVPEYLFDAAGTVSGCGPAYMYMFAEALADGAVACGVPRAKAYEYAAMTMVGAAQMYLQTKTHPGALKDAVCSPGGATLQGVAVLERDDLKGIVTAAIDAAYKRTLEMKK